MAVANMMFTLFDLGEYGSLFLDQHIVSLRYLRLLVLYISDIILSLLSLF